MTEPNLAELVLAHEPTLVDVAVDAVEMAFTGVLPQDVLLSIGEDGLTRGVLCDHELIVVEQSLEVGVVETRTGVDEGPLPVGFLHEDEELRERVAKLFLRQSAAGLDIDHRQQILIAGATLCHKVVKLLHLTDARTIEVVGTHFEPIAVSQVDVLFIFIIDARATL